MSIKDLFDKGHSLKFVKNKTRNDLAEDVESHRYIESYSNKRDRYFPDVNFATASNFARFGLAEEYYESSIKRIYQTYPYDGSLAEKTEWENESTYLDIFIFENEYPRTNGFISLNETASYAGTKDNTYNIYSSSLGQYVYFKGGPHSDPDGDYKSEFIAGPSQVGFSKANIYHTASQRTNNLELDLEKGVTTEFWLKKDGWADESGTQHEYIFHLWNSGSLEGTAARNGNMTIYSFGETSTSKKTLYLRIISGSTTISADLDTGLTNIADGNWHHYAITNITKDSETVSNLYVDGIHADRSIDTDSINAITGTMIASLGGLVGPLTGSTSIGKGWGSVASASFDEFRYWKSERNARQVGRFWRDQIGGGTNTDNKKYDKNFNKVDLGVYYKFNEGIVGDSGIDSNILDYSGRISNGELINYDSTCRSTGSAIILSNAATKEFKDPIIYSTHPDVESLIDSKKTSGSMHDHENSVSLYKSLPGWILEEDEEKSNNLKYFTQILANYFDDLYLQIEKLPTLKDINYPDDNSYEKPLPFAERLLDARGYNPPELFSDISDLAKYLNRDEKIMFEKKLYEVKNIIYQNIYNNLSFIQKSKGTYKSLRNFLRCFGIDEELIKLNVYSNDGVYEFKDNESNVSVRKKYIDFDDLETRFTASGDYADSFSATAYQATSSVDANSISYIPAATESLLTGAMMTIETEIVFPKRKPVTDINYQMFPSLTSSIFGLHAVQASDTQLTYDPSDTINFNIVATKPDNDLRNVKFGLITSGTSVFANLLNTSSITSVYDNEKWNIAFRLRPTKSKTDTTAHPTLGSGWFLEPAASAYTYELYGVNYLSNILQNEFTLSGTISAAEAITFFTKPKRIFLGAARENFTGSVRNYSDIKISSTRVWLDYLPNEVIRAHAKDPTSYGALHPYTNNNDVLNTNYVPQISSLIMNWAMDNLTGSNASGQFLIDDFASGSTDNRQKVGNDWARSISKYNYSGLGDKFMTNVDYSDQSIDLTFVQAARLKLPEVVNSDDMVKILNKQDDVVFTRDTTYVQHLLSVEKSMYQTISEEMLKMFASATDFNNVIGEPVNRYRYSYKKLEKLRQIFFDNVENERLDLEKFIEYFKWIDDAVTLMIAQLIPVSSNSLEMLRNMIESHIFERNKYFHKFPTFELKPHEPISPIKSIEELKYNWKFGHAPLSPSENSNQDQNCLWWKQRAERDAPGVLSSSVGGINNSKTIILKQAVTEVSGFGPTLKTPAGAKYSQTYYYNRSLARPIDLSTKRSLKIKAGSNPLHNNIHDFYKNVIKWGSDDDFIYLDVDNEIKEKVCNDEEVPTVLDKKKFLMKALVMPAEETNNSNAQGTGIGDKQVTDAKSTLVLPFSIFSSSINTGYQSSWQHHSDEFKFDITNLHDDKYGVSSEIPLQGTFTEKHVGGMQHRHVKLNQGSDGRSTRPEGWHLEHYLRRSPPEYLVWETFQAATSVATTSASILLPSPFAGNMNNDPSPHEYWGNNVNSDNPWTFLSGSTPSAGTGPSSGRYAYCEVLPSKVGQTFGLRTPLIDGLEGDSSLRLTFKYHMHGSGIGTLTVQASTDKDFLSGVENILTISGQKHLTPGASFSEAVVDTEGVCTPGPGDGTGTLINFKNKRFYIRFLYTAGVSYLGDCAIDDVKVVKSNTGGSTSFVGDYDVYGNFALGENSPGASTFTSNNYFANFNGAQYYYNTGSSNLELDTFTMTAWIKFNSDMSGATGLGAQQYGKVNGIVQLGSQGSCGVTSTGSYQPEGGYRALVVSGSPGDSTRKLGFITKYGLVVSNTSPIPAPDYGRPGVYYAAADLEPDTWYHVAVSVQATSGSSADSAVDPIFYVNGAKSATSAAYAPLGQYIATADFAGSSANNKHYIGRTQWASQDLGMIEYPSGQCDASPIQHIDNRNWEGDIDEVMIWNKQLSPQEISLIAAINDDNQIADMTQHSASSNIVAWYRFGDMYSAQAPGYVGNSAAGHSKLRSVSAPIYPVIITGSSGDFPEGNYSLPDPFEQNSFKLLHPTYDDHTRPTAMYTRDTIAKRPINIRNIHMTGNSPTTAGNFLDRYEYVSTVSPENNDPYFVKNNAQITRTTAETLLTASAISSRLAGAVTGSRVGLNYTLPDRTYLTGTTRNRTRFNSRFSSPGGYEVMSRGFLDPAHETFSVYNAMTYRNLRVIQVHNSQLQAHQGRHGISAHEAGNARVYGEEAVGSVNKINYLVNGDAATHKTHRNNIEKYEYTGDHPNPGGTDGDTINLASTNDNAFVSHMIPRTDNQTRWITASLI